MTNLLQNGNFEADWGVDKSHRCLIFPVDGESYETDVGNIFTPSGGWLTWFRHDAGTWDQPEVRDAWKSLDPNRVRSGEKATLLFSFNRRHDAGFLQQVQVEPGKRLRLTAWMYAWSNHELSGHRDCLDDPRCSCGVGRHAVAMAERDAPPLNGDPWNDAVSNALFVVGIDPTGGVDPCAATVVWGDAWYIYNSYCQELSVETEAQAETVTVFLRSTMLWSFKHNDNYIDDAVLVVVEDEPPPPEERGKPRIQYERTYVLLPPDADEAWAVTVVDATWDSHRWTVGGSADDSAIGDLDYRRVIAVNPGGWGDDLRAFFETHYPGIEYVPVEAASPEALGEALAKLE